MDKFQILSEILRDIYKNKVDEVITLKALIDLLDEVEEKYNITELRPMTRLERNTKVLGDKSGDN